jgi:hypothetical protein
MGDLSQMRNSNRTMLHILKTSNTSDKVDSNLPSRLILGVGVGRGISQIEHGAHCYPSHRVHESCANEVATRLHADGLLRADWHGSFGYVEAHFRGLMRGQLS